MEDLKDKKFVVCPAWPYINRIPHLGTILHLLSADIYVRYLKLRGADVISATGSDCHGTPIEVVALEEGITPKELVDRNHARTLELLAEWNIELNYSKTANPFHHSFVQDFYRRCFKNGYIFKKTIEQLYCETDQRFLPDRFVEGTCPYCGADDARGDQCDGSCGKPLTPTELINPRCKLCGNSPRVKKTTQWYYNFAAFQEKLVNYIQNNPHLPENARNFSEQILEEGIQARTLTRDLDWGIPAEKAIPEAKGKTIYVWLDAVLGYVSASAELGVNKHDDNEFWKQYWLDQETRTVFFIGKDNIFFHTLLLPALLLGTEDSYGKPFVLPYNVSTTEFLNFENIKFSKSKGIGVWIDDAANLLPTDYWRYYLAATRPETKDYSFTWEDFEQRINTDLNDVFGNYVHRVLVLVQKYCEGILPENHRLDDVDKEFVSAIHHTPELVAEHFDRYEYKKAIGAVLDFARKANTYLSTKEPWKLVDTDFAAAETTLFLCVQSLVTLSILSSPVLPETAEKIWQALGLEGSAAEQAFEEAGKLKLDPGLKIHSIKPLFAKVESATLIQNLDEIHASRNIITKEVKKFDQKIPLVTLEEFQRLDIRIGTIIGVEPVPKTERLLKLKVELGPEIGQRQLVAGLAEFRKQEDLLGQKITVIVNLKPTTIRGVQSEGMLLAATSGSQLGLLAPDADIPNGAKVS
ncbi:MAG: methionine--tRNA ligase [Candidatus Thorarchaeota archaeon]